MERTFALSLTPVHSSPNLTEWNANALTQWHPTLTNRLEGTLTNLPFSQTEGWRAHSLTHSLTDLPLEGVGGQIGDHTHSNSLSHTDSKARSLSHSLTYSLSLSHKLSPSLTLSHTLTLTLLLSLSLSLTNAQQRANSLTNFRVSHRGGGGHTHSLTH